MTRPELDRLAAALEDTGRLVAGVGEDQWDRPTPCAQWAVRDLVDHLVAGHRIFTRALLGEPVPGAGDPLGVDPAADYDVSAAELVAAFGTPGATERVVTIPIGPIPGHVALHLRLVEALVHGWDLARATGQQPSRDEELAAQELAFSEQALAQVIPAGRTPFADRQPVADDASALDRLAALLGRSVSP